jgi:Cu2+-exporting ATPase
MFFQLCLITAGIHLGRKLLRAALSSEDEDAPAESEGPEATGESAAESAPADHAAAEGTSAPRTALAAEDAEVQEQLGIALASTGLSIVAPGLSWLSGVGVLYGSIPMFRHAKELLVDEGRLGVEFLNSISFLAAIAARQFGISALFLLIYSAAEKLRIRGEQESRRRIIETFEQRPDHAFVLRSGAEVSIPIDSLSIGDIVLVNAGSTIPADGVIVDGSAWIDQRLLTGEPQPVEKFTGDEVFGTGVVVSGRLQIRVRAAGRSTVAAAISQILQRTADHASALELSTKRLSDATVLPILALSAASSPLLGPEKTVALLNVDITDNMRLVAPLSMLNHLRKTYEQGVLLKDGRVLQFLPAVDTVVFDKTGALMQELFQVRGIHAVLDSEAEEVLLCAAALECRQADPIARAIVAEAIRHGHDVHSWGNVHHEHGYGLAAKQGRQTARAGSRQFMQLHGIKVPSSLSPREQELYDQGRDLVYVARDRALIGIIELERVLRPEAEAVLQELRKRDLKLYLLSGDQEEPTRTLAERLRFDGHFAGVSREDKARLLTELRNSGRNVCFVGDGIKDADALRHALVSVSLCGVPTVSADSAQVVLLEPGLRRLPQLFAISDEFRNNLSGILLSAIVPTAVAIGGVFIAGFTTNAVAALYLASMAASMALAASARSKKE